jgi:hypothetical protein
MISVLVLSLLKSVARILRVYIIFAGLGLLTTGLSYCPVSQTNCDMAGKGETHTDGLTCVLACNVPLQQDAIVSTSFAGKLSSVHVPPGKSLAGLLIEPAVPPPRDLV